MAILSLKGMEFFSYHGCFPEEQLTGTHFLIDLYLHLDSSAAEVSDDLKKAIDYQSVYKIVKEEMAQHSKLIEHVGRRILDAVCSAFPVIEHAKVKVTKLNPPVGGKLYGVSIKLSSKKKE